MDPELPIYGGPGVVPICSCLKFIGPETSALQQAAAAIDEIHGVSGLALIQVVQSLEGNYELPTGIGGGYIQSPPRIIIGTTCEQPALTLFHEVGHYLDQQAFGMHDKCSSRASRFWSDLKAWTLAADNTTPIRTLRQRSELNSSILAQRPDAHRGYRDDLGWYRFYLSPEEIFARFYQQYIVTRTSVLGYRGAFTQWRTDKVTHGDLAYWEPESPEFDAMSTAFDRLLMTLGWRNIA